MGSYSLEIAPGVQLDPEGWAARLGRALQAARQQHAMTLDDVARRSEGRFTTRDLRAFERGERPAGSTLSELLAGLYAIDLAGMAPPRRDLIVDLDVGVVTAGGALRRLSGTADPAADLLQSYLDLVRGARGAGQSRVSLRADDIAVLSAALDLDEEAVVAALVELMECTKEEARRLLAFLRSGRVAVPLAVVVAVGVGLIATNTFDVPGGSRSADAPVFVTGSAAPTASVLLPVVGAPVDDATGSGGPSTGPTGGDVGSSGPSGSGGGSAPSTADGQDDDASASAPQTPDPDNAAPIRLPGLVVPPSFDNGASDDEAAGPSSAGSPVGSGDGDQVSSTDAPQAPAADASDDAAGPAEASTLSGTFDHPAADAPQSTGGSSSGSADGSSADGGSADVSDPGLDSGAVDGGVSDPGADPAGGSPGSTGEGAGAGDDAGGASDSVPGREIPGGGASDQNSGDDPGGSGDPGDDPAGSSDPGAGAGSGAGDTADPGGGPDGDPGGSSDPGTGSDGSSDPDPGSGVDSGSPPTDHDNGLHLGNPDQADDTPHTDQGNQQSESPGGGASGGGQPNGQGSGSSGSAGGPADDHDNGLHLGSPDKADDTPHTDQGNHNSESPGGGKPGKG